MKNLTIGLFGFGNVGRGLYDVLERINSQSVTIKTICVRNLAKNRGVDAHFTDNPDDIFEDKDINLIVELIDDADAAYDIVKRALKKPSLTVQSSLHRYSDFRMSLSILWKPAQRLSRTISEFLMK